MAAGCEVHRGGRGCALCETGGGCPFSPHACMHGLVLSVRGRHVSVRTHRRGSRASRPWTWLCPLRQDCRDAWGLGLGKRGYKGPRKPLTGPATGSSGADPRPLGVGYGRGSHRRPGLDRWPSAHVASPWAEWETEAHRGWLAAPTPGEGVPGMSRVRLHRPPSVPSPPEVGPMTRGVQSSRSPFWLNSPHARPPA